MPSHSSSDPWKGQSFAARPIDEVNSDNVNHPLAEFSSSRGWLTLRVVSL